MKKLLLIIVDACASRVMLPAMQQGKLPNLKRLSELGTLRPESIAVFPSLTPAATSSLVTGEYPRDHSVLGFHWYDLENDRVIYYGDDYWIIWNEGFEEFFNDFLSRLNHQRLKAETLFQRVERAGLKAASLNYLVFRGDVKHQADIPLMLSMLPGVPSSEEVYGPSVMYFGDMVDTNIKAVEDDLDQVGGFFHRFGFDDENTGKLLLQLAKARALPRFTLAYFPDNDFHSHEVGPENAVASLQEVDARLGSLFAEFDGVENFLKEFCLILTGDHSQTDMLADEQEAGINLEDLLGDFAIADPGQPFQEDDQLVICPDMRSAQVYFKSPTADRIEYAVEQLLQDERIDQLLWRAEDLGSGDKGFYVATTDQERLRFWPGTDGPHTATDVYGCSWSWEGDLSAVDGKVSADNTLTFNDYPNAFERIVGGLDSKNSGHLWATAHPGHEFCIAETSLHLGGGSHGSLHVLDSVSPLLVAGAPGHVDIPFHPRAVDVAPLCLSILGLKSEYAVGESHISED